MRLPAVALLLTAAPVAAQMPPVGRIEIFGHPESAARVRGILADLEGKEVSAEARARERLIGNLPGVAEAKMVAVCCDGGFTTLYVAVRGEGKPAPRFAPAPAGEARLPSALVALGREFERALEAAVRRGVVGDDQSAGHSLMADSAARAVQDQFITIASRELPLLREVLANSADAGHRALAAQVLAYAADKRDVLPDLLAAVRDTDETVRNVAVRAVWIIATYAAERPGLGLEIPADPFVDLLNSITWTDRNKASLVLMQLSASRDSATLRTLRTSALEPLIDMASWENPGHAFPAVVILGRIAGLTDEAIFAALSEGKKTGIIDAVRRLDTRTDP